MMAKSSHLFLVLAIVAILVNKSFSKENVKNDVLRNFIYLGDTVFEATLPSWKQCIELCARMTICKSMSYFTSSKKCQIHSEAPTSFTKFLLSSPGNYFLLASTENKKLTGVCKDVVCNTTEISIESINKTQCICQEVSFTCREGWTLWYGQCYLFVAQVMKWQNAQRECEMMETSMVKIENKWENQYILWRAIALNLTAIWIGASDLAEEGKWIWASDGSVVGYSDWLDKEPNNYKNSEHCGAVLLDNFNGKWIDDMCIKDYYYICEQ